MLKFRAVCFASAFVCANAFAQNCSGGTDGGMDANGNQCSEAAAGFDIAPVTQRIATPPAIAVTPVPIPRHLIKRAGGAMTTIPEPRPLTSSPSGEGSHRHPGQTTKTILTARPSDSPESLCSGGADGGMDATGNQCGTEGSPLGTVSGR